MIDPSPSPGPKDPPNGHTDGLDHLRGGARGLLTGLHVGPPGDPDRYLLLLSVGHGSEGEVFKARVNGEPVAVKVMFRDAPVEFRGQWDRADALRDRLEGIRGIVPFRSTFWAAFPHEKGAIKPGPLANHARTVRVLPMDYMGDPDSDAPPLNMHKTLHKQLEADELLPAVRLDYLLDLATLARAIDTLHQNELLYRDIKLSNMIRTPSGVIVGLDPTVIREIGDGEPYTQIHTPGYTAPEFPATGPTKDTDRYALGCCAINILLWDKTMPRTVNAKALAQVRDTLETVCVDMPDLVSVLTEMVSEVVLLVPKRRLTCVTWMQRVKTAIDRYRAESTTKVESLPGRNLAPSQLDGASKDHVVVVDGSNMAHSRRTNSLGPSLVQLREAVASLTTRFPDAELVVAVDANLRYRAAEPLLAADPLLYDRFEDELRLQPAPAGMDGGGDAWVCGLAADALAAGHRVTVVTNDSYKQLHQSYPWLLDKDRVLGGQPTRRPSWTWGARRMVRANMVPHKPASGAGSVKAASHPEPATPDQPDENGAQEVEGLHLLHTYAVPNVGQRFTHLTEAHFVSGDVDGNWSSVALESGKSRSFPKARTSAVVLPGTELAVVVEAIPWVSDMLPRGDFLGARHLVCYDLVSGRQLWREALPGPPILRPPQQPQIPGLASRWTHDMSCFQIVTGPGWIAVRTIGWNEVPFFDSVTGKELASVAIPTDSCILAWGSSLLTIADETGEVTALHADGRAIHLWRPPPISGRPAYTLDDIGGGRFAVQLIGDLGDDEDDEYKEYDVHALWLVEPHGSSWRASIDVYLNFKAVPVCWSEHGLLVSTPQAHEKRRSVRLLGFDGATVWATGPNCWAELMGSARGIAVIEEDDDLVGRAVSTGREVWRVDPDLDFGTTFVGQDTFEVRSRDRWSVYDVLTGHLTYRIHGAIFGGPTIGPHGLIAWSADDQIVRVYRVIGSQADA